MAELIEITRVLIGLENMTASVRLADDAPIMTSEDLEGTTYVYRLMPHIVEHEIASEQGGIFREIMGSTDMADLLAHVTVELLSQTGLVEGVPAMRTWADPKRKRGYKIELACADDVLVVAALSCGAWILDWAYRGASDPDPDIEAIVAGLVQLVENVGGSGEDLVVDYEAPKPAEEPADAEDAADAEALAMGEFGVEDDADYTGQINFSKQYVFSKQQHGFDEDADEDELGAEEEATADETVEADEAIKAAEAAAEAALSERMAAEEREAALEAEIDMILSSAFAASDVPSVSESANDEVEPSATSVIPVVRAEEEGVADEDDELVVEVPKKEHVVPAHLQRSEADVSTDSPDASEDVSDEVDKD